MKIIPTKNQWQKWTLPAKFSYIGVPLSVIVFIIGLVHSEFSQTHYSRDANELIKKVKSEINYNSSKNLNKDKRKYNDEDLQDLTEFISLIPIYDLSDTTTKKAIEYYNRGTKKLHVNNIEAINLLSIALTLKPDFIGALYHRAHAYSFIDNYDLAIKDYTSVVKLNEKFSKAYYFRGNCLMHLKQYESAEKDYSITILLNPKFAQAYLYRGNTKTYLNDDQGAINDLNKCIELSPNSDLAYYNLGLIYFRNSDYNKALSNYTKAIELNSSDFKYFEQRAYSFILKRELKRACEDINIAASLGLDITKNGLNLICKYL